MIFKKKHIDFHYKSISDLPISLWWDISATQDYKLLVKEGKNCPKKYDLEKVWAIIFDEYIEKIGLNDKFKEWMALRVKAADYWARSFIDGDRSLRTLAKVQERRANDLIGEQKDELSAVSAMVSKFMGFEVSPERTSVLRFHEYLKLAQNG